MRTLLAPKSTASGTRLVHDSGHRTAAHLLARGTTPHFPGEFTRCARRQPSTPLRAPFARDRQWILVALLCLSLATPAQAATVPSVDTFKLPNGLLVMLREDGSVPLVGVSFRARAGSLLDASGQEGTASLTAKMLLYGTDERTEEQINKEIERLGASLHAGSGSETFVVSGDVPTIDSGALDQYLAIFADVLLDATFPEEGLERVRNRQIGQLQGLVDNHAALAERALDYWAFGNHAYARPTSGTLASLKTIDRSDLANFHKSYILPQNSVLGISGDFDAKRLKKKLRKLFSKKGWGQICSAPRKCVNRCKWSQKEKRCKQFRVAPDNTLQPNKYLALLRVEQPKGRRILLLDTGDATLNQAQFRMGNIIQVRYADKAWDAYHLAAQILGGDFTARLNDRLRVKEGLTYGARFKTQYDDRVPGMGYVSTYTTPKEVSRAIKITLTELKRLREQEINPTEMQVIQRRISQGFVFRFETASSTLSEHLDLWQEQLSLKRLASYPDRIGKLTVPELKPVLNHFPLENMVIVIVGNEAMKEDIAKLAEELGAEFQFSGLDVLGI